MKKTVLQKYLKSVFLFFQWTFRLYDIDGNGVLDPGETLQVLTDILALLRPPGSSQAGQVQGFTWEIFQMVNLDRKGVLSQSEFLASCLEHSQVRRFLLPSSHLLQSV